MKLRKLILSLLIVLLLTAAVSAQDIMEIQAEVFGAEELTDALNGETKELMDEFSPLKQNDAANGVVSIFKKAVSNSGMVLKNAVASMVQVLLVVILCQLAESVFYDGAKKVVAATGALSILAICANGLHAMVGLGRSTMVEITDFSNLLLPVMVSAATASGAITSAGALYTMSTVFSNLLLRFCSGVLVPASYAYLALALTDSVVRQERLKKMRELIGWGIEKTLKAVMYLFTGFLSVTGILGGVADAAAMKAAKFAISGAVPVVGGIISGAASTILSGASLLKSTTGTFGMLAIFALFITPFLNMGASYLMMRLSAALSGIFDSTHSGLLEAVSGVMGYMLAMTASCALIALLSCCFLVKAVQI